MRLHLTDAGVRALKPASKQTKVWDTQTLGFGILVGGKSKTWFVMYGPRCVFKSLGGYPAVSLAEARKRAQTLLGTRPDPSTAPKFESVIDEFLEDNYKDAKGRRTKSEAKRLLNSHFPTLKEKRLSDITDAQISDDLSKLADRPSEQLHAFRAVRTFLRWCTRPPRRYIGHSPLEGYRPPGEDRKGSRILFDTELMKVWEACGELATFGTMIRLMVLWDTRNGETGRLQRSWLEDGVMVISGEVTKNQRDHAVPVLPIAKKLLEDLPMAGKFYFPGRAPDTHFNDGSWGKLKKELDDLSQVFDWDFRDIRRTFRSNMAKLKVPRHIGEILINHVTGTRNELDEIYDRYDYIDEKREALSKYEMLLTTLLRRRAA
ncbi:MAG: hypothetical protein QOI12_430 [Alphaproteobacteria bacterium]|jgi:integrase|nr:hypothetical protein [Alphaproteobacteria bacterium]